MKTRRSPRSRGDPSPPGKWGWHHRALLRLRDTLRQERDERRAALRAERDDSTRDSADVAADDIEQRELLAALDLEENELSDVEAALGRIATGTYGRCEATGRPIPRDRLRAVPWTRYAAPVTPKGAAVRPASQP